MIRDIEIINNPGLLSNMDIILYGTGSSARGDFHLLKNMGIDVKAFAATDSDGSGMLLERKVMSVRQLKEYAKDNKIIIVISSMYFEEIHKTIEDNQIDAEYVCTEFGLKYALLFGVNGKVYDESCCKWFYSMMNYHRYCYSFSEICANTSIGTVMTSMNMYDDVIMVYQYGKCGSLSVYDTLKKKGKNVVHIHHITDNLSEESRRINNELVEDLKKNIKSRKNIKIITMVREPISRIVSNVFYLMGLEDTDWYYGMDYMKQYDNITEFVKNALCFPLLEADEDTNGFMWFENELKAITGVDVLQHEFDTEKGYSLIKQDNIEVLILQMEKMNDNVQVIGDFAGIDNLVLENTNMAENKNYQYVYAEMKKDIKIPREIFDTYYDNNPYMVHFYSEKDRKKFADKWSRHIG